VARSRDFFFCTHTHTYFSFVQIHTHTLSIHPSIQPSSIYNIYFALFYICRKAWIYTIHSVSFSFFFFFFAFSRTTPVAYGGSQAKDLIGAVAAGLHQSHSNAGFQTASAAYTRAQSNARSLTHGVRPGIKPAISWFLVRFVNHWARSGTPYIAFQLLPPRGFFWFLPFWITDSLPQERKIGFPPSLIYLLTWSISLYGASPNFTPLYSWMLPSPYFSALSHCECVWFLECMCVHLSLYVYVSQCVSLSVHVYMLSLCFFVSL